ncbi:cation transporter [Nonomuraea sp. SYSU D8015]|uniref:cation transporter n=1 Tax=Nonomuraea sp. SYSU D8015 TaxID=2593644 RepID=UPI001CB73DA3|nr:cation transporter [Nonomuraea sp. SYSU D8015]
MPDQRIHERPAASADWLRAARAARALSVATLAWLGVESTLGLAAGLSAHSVALIGWALSALVEAAASLIVLWRFTGARTLSPSAETSARRAVAVSFWLLAPYLVVHVAHDLGEGQRAAPSALGIVVTAFSLVSMPVLGMAKRRLGRRLASAATSGEGAQNLLCGAMAAGVLAGLWLNTMGCWWVDPVVALVLAAVAVREGRRAWRGNACAH